jgi:hypothetical protein
MSNAKWKSKLVSSSIPLEFEVAKLLASNGFAISADFTYSRNDSGIIKDFSTDINATGYLPLSDPNKMQGKLELLIECKQRYPSIKWLFFPDPNNPDFSPITLGRTISAVDEFSLLFFPRNVTVPFDETMDFCYKGVEINEESGQVHDSELKHGIAQLQYALPRLLTENIMSSLRGGVDSVPFLYCPILLTTAELFVANDTLTTEDVENSTSISDFAKQVPFLVLFSEYGPDFEKHCQNECSPLANLSRFDSARFIQNYRRNNGEYEHQLPMFLGSRYANGLPDVLISSFSQFVICTMSEFQTLVNKITEISTNAVDGLGASANIKL